MFISYFRTSTEGLNRSIKIVSQSVYDDVNVVYDRPPFITKFEIVNPLLSINNFTVMRILCIFLCHFVPFYVLFGFLGNECTFKTSRSLK